MLAKNNSKKARKGSRKRRSSAHRKWLSFLRSRYGVFSHLKDDGREWFIQWTTSSIPPRMPRPDGPAPGAMLTTVQMVNSFGDSTGVTSGLITQNAPTALFGQIAFTVGDLPQISSFSNLFDQYRIEEIHLRLRSHNPAAFNADQSSTNYADPYMSVVVDRDDGTNPSSMAMLQDYDNQVVVQGSDSVDLVLEPSITPAVFATGSFSGYAIEKSAGGMWLDMANTSIPHYGVKFGVIPLATSTTSIWQWEVTSWYKVSFKNIR